MDVSEFSAFKDRLVDSVSTVIVGKKDVIGLVACDLVAGGHVLFEDFPGLGKTTLAKAVARALGCDFKRIQFTADLLPADITGTYVLEEKKGFRFLEGPVFTQVLLADEINRSPPKTQSALLEAMQERQVTAENQTFKLPQPFVVFATQNPIEYEGTYPLPEAQTDRFSMRLRMGYPSAKDEASILEMPAASGDLGSVTAVSTPEGLVKLQSKVESVFADDSMKDYIVSLAASTRNLSSVDVGVSPRGAIHLFRLCKARAACSGRDYITPDDVKELAVPALAHRLTLAVDYQLKGVNQQAVIEQALKATPVPKVIPPAE